MVLIRKCWPAIRTNPNSPTMIQNRNRWISNHFRSNLKRSDQNRKPISMVSVNLPPQLCVPAFEALVQELKKNADTSGSFEWFLLICKTLEAKKNEKSQKSAGNKRSKVEPDQLIYLNGEEELFEQAATEQFQ